jgi:type II secretory pathway component GspD/PulD (secretin)
MTSAAAAVFAVSSVTVGAATSPSASEAPGVFTLQNGNPDRIATILRTLYPGVRIIADRSSNSIVAFGSPSQIAQMRTVVAQLDVKNPTQSQTTAIPLKSISSSALIPKLHVLFPNSRFSAGPNKTLLVDATPADLAQIKDVVAAVDVAPPAGPVVARMTDAVKLQQSQAADVVRVVAARIPAAHASAVGNLVLLSGPSDAVAEAKALILKIDLPAETTPITAVYRLHSVDAQSVADLLQRSFPSVRIDVEKELNALAVLAPPAIQTRIASAIEQLDGGTHVTGAELAVAQPGEASQPVDAGGGQAVEVMNLRAAVPAVGTTGGSTTAQDIANAVQAALARSAPGLHITVQPNATQLILTGTPDEIRLGKELVNQLDVQQKLVVLDTEILEVDESAAKNLGLQIQTPAGATAPQISTVISENVPTPQPGYSSPPQFLGLLPFTRTGLSIGLQLGLLVSRGDARILADPRITTISGRTATIRAGDNITVQTQAGGGAGTVATTQLQTFQTGVSLDITPVINSGNFVSILLHPVVNNLSGYSNGIPQISTRDTQTTVGMQADQTLVIGGLIEDSTTNTVTKIPFLGDLPVVGGAFRNRQYSRQRNELVITVTPHIIVPGQPIPAELLGNGGTLTSIPTPEPLPTLPPGTLLPPAHPLSFVTSRPFVSATPPVLAAGAGPTGRPSGAAGSPKPGPTPSAFAQANVFTYGAAPQNTFALPGDPPKIFYINLSPTVMRNNVPFTISAITTTNISSLQLQTNNGATTLAHSGGAGFWQSTIIFTAGNIPPDTNQLNFLLIASKDDGTTQRINIPVSYAP